MREGGGAGRMRTEERVIGRRDVEQGGGQWERRRRSRRRRRRNFWSRRRLRLRRARRRSGRSRQVDVQTGGQQRAAIVEDVAGRRVEDRGPSSPSSSVEALVLTLVSRITEVRGIGKVGRRAVSRRHEGHGTHLRTAGERGTQRTAAAVFNKPETR